jgi:serine/threonine protein phosphatase PrpC
VTGVVTSGPETAHCPQCGQPVEAEHRFCEECGTDLRVRRGGTAHTSARTNNTAAPACRGCGAPAPPDPAEEYCPECGLRRRDNTDRVETELGDLAGVSDRGRVHARNEDAMALGRHDTGAGRLLRAAVVCDGVSTVRTPELAARLAAQVALDVLLVAEQPPDAYSRDDMPGDPMDDRAAADGRRRVGEAVAEAAARVAELGQPDDDTAPSCTLVCALVSSPTGDGGGHTAMTVGWVGDSRAYWLATPGPAGSRAGNPAGDTVEVASRLLTVDHSWAAEMVQSGELSAEDALAAPRAHVITRWLGRGGDAEPGVLSFRPDGPGVLLLCSDGLWNYCADPADLASLIGAGERPGVGTAAAFTELALAAGGRDNITVCLIPVGTPSEGPFR